MAAPFKRYLRYTVPVLAAGLLFAPAAGAQTPNNAATPPANAQTPPANNAVTQFLANPTQSLARYANGGAALISLIRDIAVTRPDALQTLADLLATANRDQQTAFGSGLGQAYKIVVLTDQAYATRIAELIGNSASDNAKLAYAGATGDAPIGAAGGGGDGGGAGGGSGGQTGSGGTAFGGVNTGSSQTSPTSFQTSSQTFTGGGGGASGAGSSTPVSAR